MKLTLTSLDNLEPEPVWYKPNCNKTNHCHKVPVQKNQAREKQKQNRPTVL